MSKFLLDANLSPETSAFLRTLGLDAADVVSRGMGALKDPDVVILAKAEGRVLITFDLDFGEIYYHTERDRIGVIILRLPDQTIEAVNQVLETFFRTVANTIDLEHSLVVVEPNRVRIST